MSSLQEVWKDIEGYEGHYQISSFGRVLSIRRRVWRSHQGYVWIAERVMKPRPVKGYAWVNLALCGTCRSLAVHLLVMRAFGREKPSGTHQVNHKDGNKQNNSIDNLEWVTPRENVIHAHQFGLRNGPEKGKPLAKLSFANAVDIYDMRGKCSALAVGMRYGVSERHVYQIWAGRKWPSVRRSREAV